MVAYNFKPEFADMVASGKKRQTIRPVGKRRHASAGEEIQLYTKQRTKNCRLLGVAICVSSNYIEITDKGVWISCYIPLGRIIKFDYLGEFARADGFKNATEFLDFFERNYTLPFVGVLIQWSKPIPPP